MNKKVGLSRTAAALRIIGIVCGLVFSSPTYGEIRDSATWEILVMSGLKFACVAGFAFLVAWVVDGFNLSDKE
jgi:hypothetical protein